MSCSQMPARQVIKVCAGRQMIGEHSMRYLNSFRPLCHNKLGRIAIKNYGLPPFIDASCRREPDFQSRFPSISALCRGALFAPRLREGDSVIYMTVKGRYEPERFSHWRLVSILRVIKRFESHREAADWYQNNGMPIPSNCMVEGNEPLSYDMTIGVIPPNRFGSTTNTDALLRIWDRGYKDRASKCGVFLACEADFLELHKPSILTDEIMLETFGRIPPTLTPPAISESEFAALCERVRQREIVNYEQGEPDRPHKSE
jgi:hypothetical protein